MTAVDYLLYLKCDWPMLRSLIQLKRLQVTMLGMKNIVFAHFPAIHDIY